MKITKNIVFESSTILMAFSRWFLNNSKSLKPKTPIERLTDYISLESYLFWKMIKISAINTLHLKTIQYGPTLPCVMNREDLFVCIPYQKLHIKTFITIFLLGLGVPNTL